MDFSNVSTATLFRMLFEELNSDCTAHCIFAELIFRLWDAQEEQAVYLEDEMRKFMLGFAYKPKEENEKKFNGQGWAASLIPTQEIDRLKNLIGKPKGQHGQKDKKNRKRDKKGRFLPEGSGKSR